VTFDYCIECSQLHTVCEGCGRCQHCGCECLEVDDEAVKARKRNTSLLDGSGILWNLS
jgi:hypothetical protein